MARSRNFTLYLCKPETVDFSQAKKENVEAEAREFELSADSPVEGVLLIKTPREMTPWWLNFISDYIVSAPQWVNQSVAAVLLMKIPIQGVTRIFAVTFGHGKSLLNMDSMQPDFGLKTALNILDHNGLRTIDVKTIEEGTIHTRKQTSKLGNLQQFGLDVSRDLLNAVTGLSIDSTLAKRVSGANSLALAGVRLDFNQIEAWCRRIFEAYNNGRYMGGFSWIDNLSDVSRQKSLCESLDQILLGKLTTRDLAKVHLAPPEIVAWNRVSGFVYNIDGQDDVVYSDPDINEFLTCLGDSLQDLTVDRLHKKFKLIAQDDNGQNTEEWPIYSCLVFEADFENNTYVLTNGSWFRVANDFAAEVNNYVVGIRTCDLDIPEVPEGLDEPAYNRYVPTVDPEIANMDRIEARVADETYGVEFCDLLSRSNHLIHVKRWSSSSTMSHLFNQGLVSARALLSDAAFRERVSQRIPPSHRAIAELISAGRPQSSGFEVVYAIIHKNRNTQPAELPFFTKLCLKQACTQLDLLGFKYSIKMIYFA